MYDMIANIGREYDPGSREQHPLSEVQNFYMILVASYEKVHDGSDVTILQAGTTTESREIGVMVHQILTHRTPHMP
jgi:hypothetical protein